LLLAFGAGAMLLAACGLPSDNDASPIKAVDVPFALAETTTTSTTTTTLPPATTTTTVAPTTTTSTIATEPLTVWFIFNAKLQPVTRLVARPIDTTHVLDQLRAPTETEQPAGMRSAVPAGSVLNVMLKDGVATVDLAPSFVLNTPNPDQALAFGQMVLTLTGRPGVGQVRFTTNGQPQTAILPDGSTGGGPFSADQYAPLRNA
jgi:spore germination protein GerM